jgi:hypothetical protein
MRTGTAAKIRANLSANFVETATAAQYRPHRGRYRLMIGLGVALGVFYFVFLGVWYWATRMRPRAIDTTRRMH